MKVRTPLETKPSSTTVAVWRPSNESRNREHAHYSTHPSTHGCPKWLVGLSWSYETSHQGGGGERMSRGHQQSITGTVFLSSYHLAADFDRDTHSG